MKLTRKEFQRSKEQHPLELFRQGIRSKQTLEKYERTLKMISVKILEDMLEGDFKQRISQLVQMAKEDPDWALDLLLNISKKLRERTELLNGPGYLSPSSIENYFKPLKKLFEMNDIVISWARIYVTFPERNNMFDGRGWELDEIQKMLHFAKGPMDRSIILIAASSGIRSGGFDLNWGDVTPVYMIDDKLTLDLLESEVERARIVCAMLKIYRGTNSEYPAFITPEAYEALQEHRKEWIHQVRREPKPEDPIFKLEGVFPRRASTLSIKKHVERIVQKANLRPYLQNGKRRHDVPIMNGFRRFWNKTTKESLSKDSPLASLIKKEFMMGHTGLTKLDRNYFKTHVLDLAEEYLALVHDLTISNENRLRVENTRLRRDNDVIRNLKTEMEDFKESMVAVAEISNILSLQDPVRREEAIRKLQEKHNLDINKPVTVTINVNKDYLRRFPGFSSIVDEFDKHSD